MWCVIRIYFDALDISRVHCRLWVQLSSVTGCILRPTIRVTGWFTCVWWAPCRNMVPNTKESRGQNTSGSFSTHNVVKGNNNNNKAFKHALPSVTCRAEVLRGYCFMPALPWKMRDVTGSWWIGIWDTNYIEVDLFVIMFVICQGSA